MDESASVTDHLLRVLIVDGDGRVRRGLRALLEAQPDIVVIGEAATAAQAAQCSAALRRRSSCSTSCSQLWMTAWPRCTSWPHTGALASPLAGTPVSERSHWSWARAT